MKIGILSDSHDNLENFNKAIDYLNKENIKTMIFCGDLCSPIPMKKCLVNYSGQVHMVFGNTEDRVTNMKLSLTEINNVTIHGEHGEIEFDNIKIGFTHYPLYAKGMAYTGEYDAVFHGHNHGYSFEMVKDCLLANPGELMGAFEDASFCIFNTERKELEHHLIKELSA